MDKETFDLYVQQFKELEELLNTEFLDMKQLLISQDIDLTTTHFISFMESEEGVQYGVLLTKNKEVITFEIDAEEHIKVKFINDDAELAELKINDPSIEAALNHSF